MYTPQFSTSDLTSITVFVDDPSSDDTVTGGAALDSIHFQYKLSTDSSYTDIQGQDGSYSTSPTATTPSSLTGGSSYDFRVRVHNAYGWGSYSGVATFTASSEPDTPDETAFVISIQ